MGIAAYISIRGARRSDEDALEREQVAYVLVGSTGMAIHGVIRATRDTDIYVPPEGDFWIDILARLGERFHCDDLEWQQVTIEDVVVRVATPRMLYRMKRDTIRPLDKHDAAELERRFDVEDDRCRFVASVRSKK